MLSRDRVAALAASLTTACPATRRSILGQSLYPLVEAIEHVDDAAKVTAMLLDMYDTAVLYLLESPDALKSTVAYANDYLRQYQDVTTKKSRISSTIQSILQLHNQYSSINASSSVYCNDHHCPTFSCYIKMLCRERVIELDAFLTTACPTTRRLILRDCLYPLVEANEHVDDAAKVTAMLLEMDYTELLQLLVYPEALKYKVAEVSDVLREHQAVATKKFRFTDLAEFLANVCPPQTRTLFLGQSLYPLVEAIEYVDDAAKVTGMLLELDDTEVLHLLDYPDALKSRVAEASDALRRHQAVATKRSRL